MNGFALERPLLLALLAGVPVALALAVATRQESVRGARLATSALLRALTLALVAVAAAGPSLVSGVERTCVVFTLDASPSMPARGRAEGWRRIQELAASLEPGARAAVVEVAGEARVVVPMGAAERVAQTVQPDVAVAHADVTDLARGLRLAEALLEPGTTARVVLLSDGRETRGSARDEAERLRARGVAVDVVAIPGEAPLDARVVGVTTGSPEAREGEGLIVRVAVEATRAVHARVELWRDGEKKPGWEREVELEADKHETLAFVDRAERRGLHLYEARVSVAGDEEPRNDRGGCALLVRGGPEAVVVETNGEGEAIARVLDAQGFRVRRVAPPDCPGARELQTVDLVVLAGARLYGPEALPHARAKDIEQYVREGGGLLAVGGPESFALGGWHESELETALPVHADPPARGEQPSVALVIAIDKSGSMRGPKIELAKLAAKSATTGLSKQDQLGIIAFNFNAYWIVPLTPLVDPAGIRDRIDFQIAGGGTDLMPSLQAARACLQPLDVKVKHFLVLTDGIAGNEDAIVAYTADLAAHDITTSTVAVGEDADQDFLKRIAAAGHGRHYSADRVRELPKVVLQETLVAAQRAMEESPFKPTRRRPHAVLAGVDIEHAPMLHGLNATRAKALAQVPLTGPRDEPLLALWEHGLGRAAAWTSDATRSWAADWLAWPGFPKLVGQLARHLARREGSERMSVELTATPGDDDESVLVRAETRDSLGRFAEDVALEAVVLAPDTAGVASGTAPGSVAREAFAVVAPGRLEARIRGLAPGTYVVAARAKAAEPARSGPDVRPPTADPVGGAGSLPSPGTNQNLAVAGFARSYPREYAAVGADRGALAAIARAGGGTQDARTLLVSKRAGSERVPVGAWLLLAAALLVPVELALRRLGRAG